MNNKMRVFRRSSRTYFWSSFFFPRRVRLEVATLYAFVRTADDFVDQTPKDQAGFEGFYSLYQDALSKPVGDEIIDDFVSLMRRRSFDSEWVEAFFAAMRTDLGEVDFSDEDELLEYVYGSAEVIGLMMSRIMGLSYESDHAARMLGRSMQLINMVRDINEDNELGRTYIPASWRGSLNDLRAESVQDDAEEFSACISRSLDAYKEWYAEAEKAFSVIPYRCRVPIRTATDMYLWTAKRIRSDPHIVFRRKVKPSKMRVLGVGYLNVFRCMKK